MAHAVRDHDAPESLVRRDFASPPVTEVVLSVALQPLALGVTDLVDLWRRYFQKTFPSVEEQPPFTMPIEALGIGARAGLSFELSAMPPSPRLWFLDSDKAHLIQLQRDFIAFNWRRVDNGTDYPRYSRMREAFSNAIRRLESYASDLGLGSLTPTQAEISYFNHIEVDANSRLSSILKVVRDTTISDKLLPEAERLLLDYPIIRDGALRGRLHVASEPVIRRSDMSPIVSLTITVRGLPYPANIDGILAFLDDGSDIAVQAFVDLTTEDMHRKWGME